MVQKLKELLKEVEEKEIKNNISLKYVIKDCLKNAIEVAIKEIQENEKSDTIEKIVLSNFREAEEFGWKIKDSKEILNYWFRLGNILEFQKFEKKINHFSQNLTVDEKIKQLKILKDNKKVCALPSAPIFYKETEKLMNEVLENVISQLLKSERIDNILQVFDDDLERFENLITEDYGFGDTEDRECVGEFFTKIMSIVGVKYSRGVLNSRLF